ncbi:rRNA (guanine-N2)-methyltransferase [Deltaproteobacteria bacterium]|nr:rRNA (guanine-N2)-methyltransferase [Deltaproteobacteria bacterium]
MKRLTLTADTVGPVGRGHPWVYHDGVHGKAEVGEGVELLDTRGKRVAYGIFDEGTIAVRVLGRDVLPIPELLRARLKLAWSRRALVAGDTDTFRVCNGEGDGLGGLVVDRYGEVLVVRLYSKAWERHLGTIVDVLMPMTGARTVFRRFGVGRVDDKQGGETLRGPEPADVVVVKEHGMKLLVRVREGQKTGLFLDQREHRRLIREWASERVVVNLFSYNGGFSVAAALGGAKRVTSVDVAEAAIADARENFRLNGLDPSAHAFVATDAFTYVAEPSDLVIVDPPSLTHAAKADTAARAAYKSLHRHVATYATDLVATSSCTARLTGERWEEAVREGLGGGWASMHRSGEPVDHPVAIAHPEGRYLKFALYGRLGR